MKYIFIIFYLSVTGCGKLLRDDDGAKVYDPVKDVVAREILNGEDESQNKYIIRDSVIFNQNVYTNVILKKNISRRTYYMDRNIVLLEEDRDLDGVYEIMVVFSQNDKSNVFNLSEPFEMYIREVGGGIRVGNTGEKTKFQNQLAKEMRDAMDGVEKSLQNFHGSEQ